MRYYREIDIQCREPFYYVVGKRKWWFITWWEYLSDGYTDFADAERIYMSAKEWNGIDK